MFLGLCLEQWYYIFSIVGSIALVATLVFVIRYARAAREQVEKTHKLVLKAEEQAKATRALVLQEEKGTIPNVTGKVVPAGRLDVEGFKVSGLIFKNDYIVIINLEFFNISKGTSKFIIKLLPYFTISEMQGNAKNNRMHNLTNKVFSPFITGERVITVKPSENLHAYAVVNFKDVFNTEAPKLRLDNFYQLLIRGYLHVKIFLDYVNEREEIGSSERFYDLYLFYPAGDLKNLPDNTSIIPGRWVLEGRAEDHRTLDSFLPILRKLDDRKRK